MLNTEMYRSGHNGADSKSVREQSPAGSNPAVSAIGNPHKHRVYADFPYPNKFYGRNKIPAILLFLGYCYHDFQDNKSVIIIQCIPRGYN